MCALSNLINVSRAKAAEEAAAAAKAAEAKAAAEGKQNINLPTNSGYYAC